MKSFFALALVSFFVFKPLQAESLRTDGPPGSEYGKSPLFDGELQFGFHFGSLIRHAKQDSASFSLGLDADWRPDELFGFKVFSLFALQKPRDFVISMLPLMHTQWGNLKPYAIFGPSLAIVQVNSSSKLKFGLSGGLGADVMITSFVGFGMQYLFHTLIGFRDLHYLGARVVFVFP
jgi:hypothetical protein